MKPKLLYIMNVNWDWIAQRPHFIARELEKYFDITVVYPTSLRRNYKMLQSNTYKPQKCFPFKYTYRFEHSTYGRKILNSMFLKGVHGDIHEFEFIWISSPLFINFIPNDYSGIILSDYMDDYEALTEDSMKKIIKERELKLFSRASMIYVSSYHLLNYVKKYFKEAIYVPNAVNGKKIYSIEKVQPHEIYKLGYVGTISEWMDWKLILKCINNNRRVQFHFWGPIRCTNIPKNPNIIFHGVVEHEKIYDAIRDTDCLIMPFILNDITYAVDPVKLYEYIGFGKCIISIKYPEVERFMNFVWGYSSDAEFIEHVNKLTNCELQPKYSRKQQIEFINNNTWENRVSEIIQKEPINIK